MTTKQMVETIKTDLNSAAEGFSRISMPDKDKSPAICYMRKAVDFTVKAKDALNNALKTLK